MRDAGGREIYIFTLFVLTHVSKCAIHDYQNEFNIIIIRTFAVLTVVDET